MAGPPVQLAMRPEFAGGVLAVSPGRRSMSVKVMPILELADARIAYDAVGSGPLIVFLHGVGSDRRAWQSQLEELSATHTAVAIDARGYGGSWTRPETVSMARFAEDTVA